MEFEIIDARGMSCPSPVIHTKKSLEKIREGSVTTIVDNDAAKENVIALARSFGCEVDVQRKDNEFYIQITKKETCLTTERSQTGNTAILISASEMGRGSSELGKILIQSFMFTVHESEEIPGTIVFINSGVYLACESSPVLEHLMNLEKRGVEIISCGTCLDYFKVKEKLCVGQVTNMYTILEKLNAADKVISL